MWCLFEEGRGGGNDHVCVDHVCGDRVCDGHVCDDHVCNDHVSHSNNVAIKVIYLHVPPCNYRYYTSAVIALNLPYPGGVSTSKVS